jgi:predicted nucleic acid-binding protein
MIVLLDSEAVAAVLDKRPGVQAQLEAAAQVRARVIIPTVVLAEVAVGGARDGELWHLLKRIPCEDSTPHSAMRAGALRERSESVRRKKRDLTIDSLVASFAIEHAPSTILTADTADFRILVGDKNVVVLPID